MTKFLEPLFQPVGLLWAIHLFLAVWFIVKRKRLKASFCSGVVIIFFVFGSTSIPNRLLASLEQPYARRQQNNETSADAVLVLGGMLSRSELDPLGFDSGDAIDRILAGMELIRRQTAPTLIIGGGGGFSSGPDASEWTEAELLGKWFKDWDLPPKNIIRLELAANTREEALQVLTLSEKHGWKRLILVTSGYHMKRAEALFRKVGIHVEPVACDFVGLSSLGNRHPYSPIPKSRTLHRLDLFLHEWIGWHYYRLRGWI